MSNIYQVLIIDIYNFIYNTLRIIYRQFRHIYKYMLGFLFVIIYYHIFLSLGILILISFFSYGCFGIIYDFFGIKSLCVVVQYDRRVLRSKKCKLIWGGFYSA